MGSLMELCRVDKHSDRHSLLLIGFQGYSVHLSQAYSIVVLVYEIHSSTDGLRLVVLVLKIEIESAVCADGRI